MMNPIYLMLRLWPPKLWSMGFWGDVHLTIDTMVFPATDVMDGKARRRSFIQEEGGILGEQASIKAVIST